ncbi:MAG: hypothetical protein WCK53_03180 [Methanomicrobiales archaeon]
MLEAASNLSDNPAPAIVKISGNDLVWGRNYLVKKSCERSRDHVKTHEYLGRHTYTDGCITGIHDE